MLDKFLKIFEWKKALKLIIYINLFALILCGVTNYKTAGYFIFNEPGVLEDVMVFYEFLIVFQLLLIVCYYFGVKKECNIERKRILLSILCFSFVIMMLIPGKVKLEYDYEKGEYRKYFVNMYGIYLSEYIPISEFEKTFIESLK